MDKIPPINMVNFGDGSRFCPTNISQLWMSYFQMSHFWMNGSYGSYENMDGSYENMDGSYENMDGS